MTKNIITTDKLKQTVHFGEIEGLISAADVKSILSQTTEIKAIIVQKSVSVIDLDKLSKHKLKILVDIQKNKVKNLTAKYDEVLRQLKNEDYFWPRLKHTLVSNLTFAGASLPLTLLALFIIGSAPIITTLFILSTFAIVFLSVFILSTPLNWLISPKNSPKLTTEKNIYEKALANENTLLSVFTQAEDKNKCLMLEKDSTDRKVPFNNLKLFKTNPNTDRNPNTDVDTSHSLNKIPRIR